MGIPSLSCSSNPPRSSSSTLWELCPAVVGDCRRLAQIEATCNRPSWSQALFHSEFSLSYSKILVAKDAAGNIAGFLVSHRLFEDGHIINFGVDPKFRRRGIGSHLLLSALKSLFHAGCKSVTLEVRESNVAAQSLYKGFGFAVLGYRPRYYVDVIEDALVMTVYSENFSKIAETLFNSDI